MLQILLCLLASCKYATFTDDTLRFSHLTCDCDLSVGRHHSTLNLTIQTLGNVSSVNTQPVHCQVVGSLISTLREFKALCLLRSSTMLFPVLSADMKFFETYQDGLSNQDMPVSRSCSSLRKRLCNVVFKGKKTSKS